MLHDGNIERTYYKLLLYSKFCLESDCHGCWYDQAYAIPELELILKVEATLNYMGNF
jgi:hypothetical protein